MRNQRGRPRLETSTALTETTSGLWTTTIDGLKLIRTRICLEDTASGTPVLKSYLAQLDLNAVDNGVLVLRMTTELYKRNNQWCQQVRRQIINSLMAARKKHISKWRWPWKKYETGYSGPIKNMLSMIDAEDVLFMLPEVDHNGDSGT